MCTETQVLRGFGGAAQARGKRRVSDAWSTSATERRAHDEPVAAVSAGRERQISGGASEAQQVHERELAGRAGDRLCGLPTGVEVEVRGLVALEEAYEHLCDDPASDLAETLPVDRRQLSFLENVVPERRLASPALTLSGTTIAASGCGK